MTAVRRSQNFEVTSNRKRDPLTSFLPGHLKLLPLPSFGSELQEMWVGALSSYVNADRSDKPENSRFPVRESSRTRVVLP